MTDLQPGDRVDVTIRDAKVAAVVDCWVEIDTGNSQIALDPTDPDVTLTPHAADGELAGIEAAIEAGVAAAHEFVAVHDTWREQGLTELGKPPTVSAIAQFAIRAAAPHLDAGGKELETEIAHLKAVIERLHVGYNERWRAAILQNARHVARVADLEAENAKLRGDRALALDDLQSAIKRIADLEATK